MELYRRWDQIVREWVVGDRSETLGRVGPTGLPDGAPALFDADQALCCMKRRARKTHKDTGTTFLSR